MTANNSFLETWERRAADFIRQDDGHDLVSETVRNIFSALAGADHKVGTEAAHNFVVGRFANQETYPLARAVVGGYVLAQAAPQLES